jgi:hypothetical protein
MPQMFLRTVALHAQIILTQCPTNGHWKVADVIHFDTIGSAVRNELRHDFQWRLVGHKDERDRVIHLVQEFQGWRSLPIGGRVLGQNNVVGLRAQAFGKLLGARNYIGADVEMCQAELPHAAPHLHNVTVNK